MPACGWWPGRAGLWQSWSLISKSTAGAGTEGGPWAMNREGVRLQRRLGRSFSASVSCMEGALCSWDCRRDRMVWASQH